MAESGICSDASCRFAHNMEQLRDGHFRSKMCIFRQKGRCKNGANCHFAHSFEERHQSYLQQHQPIHGMEDGDVSTIASTAELILDSPRRRWAAIAAEDGAEEEFLQPRTLDSAFNADKSRQQHKQQQQQQQQQQQSIHAMEDSDVSPTASTLAPPLDSPRGRWAAEDEENEEFLLPPTLYSIRNADKPQRQQQQQQQQQQQSIHGMEDGDVSTTVSTAATLLDSCRGRWADIVAEDEGEEEEIRPPRTLDSACNADKPQQRQQQSVPQLQLPTVAEEETIQAQPGKTVEVSYHHLILLVVPVMPMMPFVPLAGDIEYVGPEEKEEMFKF